MARTGFWNGFFAGVGTGAAAGVGAMVAWKSFGPGRSSRVLRVENSIEIGAPVAQPKGSTDDFDYGSAAVGAGIALLIALAAVGSMVAIQRRRPVTFGH